MDGSFGSFQILVFGGGFSWGDDHGAGVIHAVRLRTHIGEQLLEFIDRGNLVIGICNGFQTLVNLGLLPGIGGITPAVGCPHFQRLRQFQGPVGLLRLTRTPLACLPGEWTGSNCLSATARENSTATETLSRLEANHQVALNSLPDGTPANGSFPHNPNGSVQDIAGICDPTGRIFGLMPHPEAYHHFTNHPDWIRRKELRKRDGAAMESGPTDGIRIFMNAVEYLRRRT